MKPSKWSPADRAKIVAASHEVGVAAAAKQYCVAIPTLYVWRRAAAGKPPPRSLKRLCEEVAELRRELADVRALVAERVARGGGCGSV